MAQDDEFFLASTVSGDGTTLGGITANEIGVLDAVDVPINCNQPRVQSGPHQPGRHDGTWPERPRISVVLLATLLRA